MNPQERQTLIEKRENGTLTSEEYQLYLDLLENDPAFADELALHQLLVDEAQTRADEQLWAALETLPAELPNEQRPFVLLVFLRQNAHYLVAAGLLLVLGVVVWRFRENTRSDLTPQLVKTEKRDVRLLADSSGLGYDDYGGSVWVRYVRNQGQTAPQTYRFCRDTLTLFLKNSGDTTRLRTIGLLFNPEQRIFYVKPLNQPLQPLRECSDTPLPFPPSP